MVKFKDVKIGQVFYFEFDGKWHNDYLYVKLENNKIMCVKHPRSEKGLIGKTYDWKYEEDLCEIVTL